MPASARLKSCPDALPRTHGRRGISAALALALRRTSRVKGIALAVFISFLAPAAAKSTTLLDRVVAAIGPAAITQSDIEQEYRLETFLSDGRIPSAAPDAATFARVESRLIDQRLLQAELSAYPADTQAIHDSAEKRLQQVSKRANFQASLDELRITQDVLLRRFEQEQQILAMIDERLRPSVTLSAQDQQNYYRNVFLPNFEKRGRGAPPAFAAVQSQIQQVLAQQKIDELLNDWLSELRKEKNVRLIPQ